MSHDVNNTTHHNNTTVSELNLKSKKKAQAKNKKVEDAVVESSPPMNQGGKKDPNSDEKFMRTGSADSTKKPTNGKTKGKGFDEEDSSSQDSDRKGPIIPQQKMRD